MKEITKVILKATGVIALAILLVGCNKSYKTILGENEDTPTTVVLDGRPDGGKVKRVYLDGSGRRIAEFTVSRDSEGLIREGVVRIPGGNAIQLRTELASGQPLPAGSYIRAESSLDVVARKWGTKAIAIMAVAAVAAVICLRRFLAFRAAAPFIPLLLATGLALLTAYSAHGLVVPIASDLVQKIQAKTESSTQPTKPDESSASATDQGWASKARGVERDVIGFLRTPVDAPRLLAFLATFAIALPMFACLIGWLFRKLACQPIVCSLLFLSVIPSALNAASAPNGVSRTLASLKEEQRFCHQSLSEIQRDLASASRLLDANLSGAPELAVRALFLSDLVGIRLEGHTDWISELKSAFGYIRADEQRKLNALYTDLRQQLQTLQLDAGKLAERCSTTTNATTILQVFKARQAEYRNLIRAGLTDAKTVIDACNRQVVQAAQTQEKPEAKPQASEKTSAELARLQREQVELQNQLETLRHAQDEAAAQRSASPQLFVVTNEVRIEKLVPAPAPPPEIRYVTNTIVITNSAEITLQSNALEPTVSTTANVAAVISANGASPTPSPPVEFAEADAASPEAGTDPKHPATMLSSKPKAKPLLQLDKTGLYLVGLITVGGFMWIAWLKRGRGTRVLQLAQDEKSLIRMCFQDECNHAIVWAWQDQYIST